MDDAFMGIAIGHQIGQTRKAQNRAATTAWKWKHYAEELEEDLEKARQRIAVLEARLAGASAQTNALLEAHPNTPLRKEKTGKRWNNPARNGAFINKLAAAYIEAHDKKARDLGIKDPQRIREN